MEATTVSIPISKWHKYNLLRQNPSLVDFLPETHIFWMASLVDLLRRHRVVVIKSALGQGGETVCKVQRHRHHYTIYFGKNVARANDLRDLERKLPQYTIRELSVVQQYICLAPYKNRPADIRTIVQRNENGTFELTGMFYKRAPTHKFVTNVKQGGAFGPLTHYLRSAFTQSDVAKIITSIEKVSLEIGNYLGGQFRNNVYGIDLGLDSAGHLWIIEVNTKPSLNILQHIDKRMHSRAIFLRNWKKAPL